MAATVGEAHASEFYIVKFAVLTTYMQSKAFLSLRSHLLVLHAPNFFLLVQVHEGLLVQVFFDDVA